MTIVVRPVREEADLTTTVRIVDATTPDDPTSLDEMRWHDATYPGGIRLLADLDGIPVGASSVGRITMYEPEFDALWGTITVLPDARRHGVGSRLLEAIREAAVAADKSALLVPASEGRVEGIAFLEHRGFTEYDRSKSVHLPLDRVDPPTVTVPAGVRLTTLERTPDLVAGIHAVALEAFADIPGGERPMDVGDLAEFRARDVDRAAIPPWGFIVAIDVSTGAVVGYADLAMVPGSATQAWHDMTAVARAWRGRGVARALKTACIAAAIEHGLKDLRTSNDEANIPMRSLNLRLGYAPLPDELTMRGSARDGIMGR